MTHICIIKLTIIGSDNGLLPGQRQAIIWTNVGILLIGPLGTNFSEILIKNVFIQENAFESVVCETAAILSRPRCVNASPEECSLVKFHLSEFRIWKEYMFVRGWEMGKESGETK